MEHKNRKGYLRSFAGQNGRFHLYVAPAKIMPDDITREYPNGLKGFSVVPRSFADAPPDADFRTFASRLTGSLPVEFDSRGGCDTSGKPITFVDNLKPVL